MALLGNYSVLQKLPLVFRAGSTTSVEGQVRSNFNKSGANRNQLYVDKTTTAQNLYAEPSGNGGKYAWMQPQKGGEISSRYQASISVSPTAAITPGMPGTGSASITITVADAAGQLITSGEGSTTVTVSTNTPLLTASINGVGEAAISVTAADATLGAEASLTGSAAIAISATNSARLPVDDTSPVRTATATISVSGELTSYAIGIMEGQSGGAEALSPAGLASAVMGYSLEAGYTFEEVVRILAAHAAGSATGLEGANPQFTGLDGATIRIDGTYAGGTRTINSLDGA